MIKGILRLAGLAWCVWGMIGMPGVEELSTVQAWSLGIVSFLIMADLLGNGDRSFWAKLWRVG